MKKSERLILRIKKDFPHLMEAPNPWVFHRVYAGWRQKGDGAWAWFLRDAEQNEICGSCYTATVCLRAKEPLVARESFGGLDIMLAPADDVREIERWEESVGLTRHKPKKLLRHRTPMTQEESDRTIELWARCLRRGEKDQNCEEEMMNEAKSGVCCSCGYDGVVEADCLKRDDETHCEHWWDGPEQQERTLDIDSSGGQ